ncbi:MAG: ABC transporter ATP-binding protein [Candidatus Caldarchaeum sp.]|nr:ABC transporter ATP-binding protein [Candidatus Caldarchaeum sp.]
MVGLRLENISKTVPGQSRIEGVSLNVEEGELFVIAGPPGSGKSMILRMVAGLEMPDSGEIYLGNERITHLPPHSRGVSMVFQSLALYPNKTVLENIAFPLRVQKVADAEIKRRVKEVADFLRIDHILNKYPRFLSGGEQQRVAVARAMIVRPKLFLFDQPLANLDAIIRVAMREEIRKIVKETGVTTLFVTHENIEALSIADRIGFMEYGRLVDVGTPHEFLSNPRDFRVARYFSAVNSLQSDVELVDGKPCVTFVNQKVPLPANQLNSSKVIVAFNMNDVMIDGNLGDSLGDGVIKARGEINMVEEHVRGRICFVRLSDDTEVKAYTEKRFELGQSVEIAIKRDKLYVFDAQTMARLI